MLYTAFRRPVTILAGLGHARRIASAADALVFLEEYPTRLRDQAYHATIEACRDTLAGSAEAQEACDVFSAFAHRRGILLDEPVEGLESEIKNAA
jgi:hypothetical protein